MDLSGSNMKNIMHYSDPYDHWVIDNFVQAEHACELAADFGDVNDKKWFIYDNPLEVKWTLNNWWNFPPATYRFIQYLNSPEFIDHLQDMTGIPKLYPDPGLHGAGWHVHGTGGKLNVHLDYSMHPKLNLERRLNLILYLSEDWDPAWGGNLQLWEGSDRKAYLKAKEIDCVFNRAIIFDTTQNSWHGFPDILTCPKGQYRKSIAMYYLTSPSPLSADPRRKRAYYMPSEAQKDDPHIMKMIEERSKT